MAARKDDHLDIRLQKGDLERIKEVAARAYLPPTQWARQLIMQTINGDRALPEEKEIDG